MAVSNSGSLTIMERFQTLPPGMKQFIKFVIVGASSTVIDWTVFHLFYHRVMFPHHYGSVVQTFFNLPRGGKTIEIVTSKLVSTSLGVLNGFYWNSKWTFRSANSEQRHKQFMRFIGVNIVGMALNTSIVTAILLPLTTGGRQPTNKETFTANAIATAIVVFWNFFANKFWTFKPGKSLESMEVKG